MPVSGASGWRVGLKRRVDAGRRTAGGVVRSVQQSPRHRPSLTRGVRGHGHRERVLPEGGGSERRQTSSRSPWDGRIEKRFSLLAAMSEWTKKSPLEWEEYVYKEVRVIASEKEYKGWLLTTDPVSANVVLVNFLEDGSLSVTGVMGHSVQTVETVNERDPRVREKLMHLFTSGDYKGFSPEDLETRKNSLRKWLEKNHIPVTEQGETRRTLCVAGVLTIDPPYAPENCSSSNEIILSRIQDLIRGHLQ